jgi:DNA-binding LacI/PurR family transcriptional regulator
VSVIGFDDHEMAAAADLTTIAQPVYRQGELGARMLLDVLAGDGKRVADIVLPTRLVVRGSTGAAPEDR